MKDRTDEELIGAFRDRGDRASLVELVSRYEGPIYAYLMGLLRNRERAEDAAQETFLRMLRGLGSYRSELPFRPWIYRIAQNTARTLAQASGRQATEDRNEERCAARAERPEDPSELAFRREVCAALDELPESEKAALLLHYSQGLSHSEVAEVLGVPPGTAATRVHQGLKALRSKFQPLEAAPAALALERALSWQPKVTVPGSLTRIILAEASKGAAAVSSALRFGGSMARGQLGALVATAVLSLSVGGVIGYQVRSGRTVEAPDSVARIPRDRDRSLRPLGRKADAPPDPLPIRLPSSPTAFIPASELSPAVRSGSARNRSLLRKLAAQVVEEERVNSRMKDRRHPTQDEQAQVAKMLGKMLGDPELVNAIEHRNHYSPDEQTEFTADLLQEAGLPALGASQTEALRIAIDAWDKITTSPAAAYSSVVEKRLAELRGNTALLDTVKSTLSADQQPLLQYLEHSGIVGLADSRPQGYLLSPPSDGQAVSYILNSWSKGMVELDDSSRAALSQAAQAHADRLWTEEAELESQKGRDFVEFFGALLKTSILSLDLDSLREGAAGLSGSPDLVSLYESAHPSWESDVREAYLRLLEAEEANRENLIRLMPGQASAIRNAKPFVYLLTRVR